jgi:hypothetical protein
MITWVNEHWDWINPDSPKGCSRLLGPIRGVARLIVGIVCGFFGGFAGTFWHAGAIFGNIGLAIKNCSKIDLKDAGKHGLSCLSDLFRMVTCGFTSGVHYAVDPDDFFASGHTRRTTTAEDPPIRIEALCPLICCSYVAQCCRCLA